MLVTLPGFGPPPHPRNLLETQLHGYLVATRIHNDGANRFQTRVAYCDPGTHEEQGELVPRTWGYPTFLAAVAGHHAVVRSLATKQGEAWETATAQTWVRGDFDINALFGETEARA